MPHPGRPSKHGPRHLLAGKKFGKLTLIEVSAKEHGTRPHWRCRCECGSITNAAEANILNGHTRSCGCIHRERARAGLNRKHGMIKTPTYYSWRAMLCRCFSPRTDGYEYYGGRGISVCDRWQKFENFLADLGTRPTGTTLERQDTNGNYEPGNCYWATAKQQAANRRNNRNLTYEGKTFCQSEWSGRLGTYPQKLYRWLKKGGAFSEFVAKHVATVTTGRASSLIEV